MISVYISFIASGLKLGFLTKAKPIYDVYFNYFNTQILTRLYLQNTHIVAILGGVFQIKIHSIFLPIAEKINV